MRRLLLYAKRQVALETAAALDEGDGEDAGPFLSPTPPLGPGIEEEHGAGGARRGSLQASEAADAVELEDTGPMEDGQLDDAASTGGRDSRGSEAGAEAGPRAAEAAEGAGGRAEAPDSPRIAAAGGSRADSQADSGDPGGAALAARVPATPEAARGEPSEQAGAVARAPAAAGEDLEPRRLVPGVWAGRDVDGLGAATLATSVSWLLDVAPPARRARLLCAVPSPTGTEPGLGPQWAASGLTQEL